MSKSRVSFSLQSKILALSLLPIFLIGAFCLLFAREAQEKLNRLHAIEPLIPAGAKLSETATHLAREAALFFEVRPGGKDFTEPAESRVRQILSEQEEAAERTDQAWDAAQKALSSVQWNKLNERLKESYEAIEAIMNQVSNMRRTLRSRQKEPFDRVIPEFITIAESPLSLLPNLLANAPDTTIAKRILATSYMEKVEIHFIREQMFYDWAIAEGKLPDYGEVAAQSAVAHRKALFEQHELITDDQTALILESLLNHPDYQDYADLLEKWRTKDRGLFQPFDDPEEARDWTHLSDAVRPLMNRIVTESYASLNQMYENLEGKAANQRNFFIVFALIAITGCLAISLLLARSIANVVHKLVGSINEGANQITEVSQVVASSSTHLSNGASEQTSRLSMASEAINQVERASRENLSHARDAVSSIENAVKVINRSSDFMKNLADAMERISANSDRTQEIIQTIDEIAFQTNILALNAAVEASRVGDAGAGFAVVADEVRTLAQRAAKAANDTSALIKRSHESIRGGRDICARAESAFSEVEASIGGVTDIVKSIDEDTAKQTSGIHSINEATQTLQDIANSNASSAEECASTAEELSAQAETLRGSVERLRKTVSGNQPYPASTSSGSRQLPRPKNKRLTLTS